MCSLKQSLSFASQQLVDSPQATGEAVLANIPPLSLLQTNLALPHLGSLLSRSDVIAFYELSLLPQGCSN